MKLAKTLIPAAVLTSLALPAQALVMDFGSGNATTTTTSTPYVQNGLTMTPLNTGLAPGNHWDWFRTHNDPYGTTNGDWQAGIHTGNNAEEVQFTFGGAAFDLLSINITNILLGQGVNSLTGTFTSSAGGNTTTSSVGIVNFTGISGFSNITSFKFSMPLGLGICQPGVVNCSTMIFDDVTFQSHVPGGNAPAPATLALLGLGLAGLGWSIRRKA